MDLLGKTWNRRSLEARVGRIDQVAGLHHFQTTSGPGAGAEHILVRTGSGFSYYVLPSRGMDIGLAEFGGIPLSWLSPNGDLHPSFYDSRGNAWLRTAYGGLMTTCGLSQVGWVGEGDGLDMGLHGRAHHTPASQVCAEGHWEGDEYLMSVQGRVEETSIFGPNLCLTRHISSRLGRNEIVIHDTVENPGFEPAPHMLLYHFNFGFPLLDTGTEIHFPAGRVVPRQPDYPADDLGAWQSPQSGYVEHVYYHEDLSTGVDGWAAVRLHNPHFPLLNRPVDLTLAWDTHNLPVLVQWKMAGEGTHVLGIEPANCHVEGQTAERKRGTLVMMEPGQTRQYHLSLTIRDEEL